MINIHHHTIIHIIGMEIIQIHMIFMVQHSSHTLLQQNDQLYGLEKFWVFLKYSRQKPKINSKLEEILKNYKNLEDFRVDGASFPQQFFPTKSNVLGRIDIGLGIGGGVINSILYNVDDDHRDIIFDRFQGVKLDVIEEGTHFMISWFHRPIIFDIRTRLRSVPSITEIKDLQTINITLRILYQPRAELLPKIFCKFGFKICCTKSQFDAIESVTQRTLISQCVSELLTERAAQFGLLLDGISITHLSFRPEFTSAVELNRKSKSIRIKFTEQSRQANVIAAEGDAHTADLIGKALDEAGDDKCLIELRRIEAAEGIANQLSKSRNSVYLPHGPQMLLNIIGATTHFQLVLSRDQGFSRQRLFTAVPLINQYPIGSILLENPYNALRKSPDLLHWYQKMKLTSAILHDFSLGGHMASLAFTK
ncbi:unnamed protein product [Rotaria sordida]|uniref:Band 7 domain-containing protein n=1 Tax=Rotaria sordida TaxID=392033 RepID=A0A816A042_9BILA|nr:unnamed protein product [Rotaria sordida]CAF1591290.1 unnamed protein product [Rotaria sordida]